MKQHHCFVMNIRFIFKLHFVCNNRLISRFHDFSLDVGQPRAFFLVIAATYEYP